MSLIVIILMLSTIGIAKKFFGVIFNPYLIGIAMVYVFICYILQYWYLIALIIIAIVCFIVYQRSKKSKYILNLNQDEFIKHKEKPWEIECPKCNQKMMVNYGSNICKNCGFEVIFSVRVHMDDGTSIVLNEPLPIHKNKTSS